MLTQLAFHFYLLSRADVHPWTLNLCMSLPVRCAPWRQQTDDSYFVTYPSNLLLSNGKQMLCAFNVIIDMFATFCGFVGYYFLLVGWIIMIIVCFLPY